MASHVGMRVLGWLLKRLVMGRMIVVCIPLGGYGRLHGSAAPTLANVAVACTGGVYLLESGAHALPVGTPSSPHL